MTMQLIDWLQRRLGLNHNHDRLQESCRPRLQSMQLVSEPCRLHTVGLGIGLGFRAFLTRPALLAQVSKGTFSLSNPLRRTSAPLQSSPSLSSSSWSQSQTGSPRCLTHGRHLTHKLETHASQNEATRESSRPNTSPGQFIHQSSMIKPKAINALQKLRRKTNTGRYPEPLDERYPFLSLSDHAYVVNPHSKALPNQKKQSKCCVECKRILEVVSRFGGPGTQFLTPKTRVPE